MCGFLCCSKVRVGDLDDVWLALFEVSLRSECDAVNADRDPAKPATIADDSCGESLVLALLLLPSLNERWRCGHPIYGLGAIACTLRDRCGSNMNIIRVSNQTLAESANAPIADPRGNLFGLSHECSPYPP